MLNAKQRNSQIEIRIRKSFNSNVLKEYHNLRSQSINTKSVEKGGIAKIKTRKME